MMDGQYVENGGTGDILWPVWRRLQTTNDFCQAYNAKCRRRVYSNRQFRCHYLISLIPWHYFLFFPSVCIHLSSHSYRPLFRRFCAGDKPNLQPYSTRYRYISDVYQFLQNPDKIHLQLANVLNGHFKVGYYRILFPVFYFLHWLSIFFPCISFQVPHSFLCYLVNEVLMSSTETKTFPHFALIETFE